MLVWLNERPLDRQKSYLLKHTTRSVRAEVPKVSYVTDLETLEQLPAERLELNDIGRVTVSCHQPLFYDPYDKNRSTGAFILVDSITNNTVAAGMILADEAAPADRGELERDQRPHTQVSPFERRELLGQGGATVWLTGLPGAGKSAIAYALERRLFDQRRVALVIDPDDGLSHETRADGASPIQTPEIARRCTDAGLITIFAYASPLSADRAAVRDQVGAERFVEVHVATSVEACKRRDQRGAYDPKRGVPRYEAPEAPEVTVSLDELDPEDAANLIVRALEKRGLLPSSYAL
jgi:bifunctional enzyme CysN/CysC